MAHSNEGTLFKHIGESSLSDWERIYESYIPIVQSLPRRILTMLNGLGDIQGALPISRLEHSLQAATRAYRDRRSDEYVFTALLHDIGSYCSVDSHAAVSAEVLKDHVSEELYWTVLHHEIFQSYHFYKQLNRPANDRDQFAGHIFYPTAEEFSALYDAPSWDRGYKAMHLADFESLIIERLGLKFKHAR